MQSRDSKSSDRARTGSRGGFLSRLAHSKAGATLPMMAMAMLPIAAMIGSGLDMSRAYMAKAKLQNACDAAALATRRFMSGNAFSSAAEAEGEKFFNFNFPEGTMGSTPVDLTIAPSEADLSVVEVTASTAVPTTIMAIFGNMQTEIAVTCDADQDYVHNDIMLVLDVTGSMNCTAGTNCSISNNEQSNSRLSRLRGAAAALYRALEGADNVRTRYGFMPYSMTVNVGADLDRGWVAEPANYWRYRCRTFNADGSCRTYYTDRWDFVPYSHDANWFDNVWEGCVEERSTIAENSASSIRISTVVDQADIDSVSTTDTKLKWQPYDPVADQRGRSISSYYPTLGEFCPAPASRLNEYDSEDDFQNQLEASLTRVGGYTNHDLGIIWGARYLSSTGMFQADNPAEIADASGNMIRVDKHIVFLTDGELTTDTVSYNSFGIHGVDNRLIGTDSTTLKGRFLNACNRARQMDMTIWVIALDVGSSGDISPCASGADHFYESDGTNLEQIFDLIGKGIGRLRLTK